MTNVYILITLVVIWITFCVIFYWIHLVAKTLNYVRSTTEDTKEALWRVNDLLSVQDVDGKK